MSRAVTVVGGGAAGIVASIAAARAGARVVLIEADERVGRKLLRTGNGRCNLSNAHIEARDFNDERFVGAALEALPPARVLSFFDGLGLLCYQDDEGRIYPQTDKASSVLDVLRLALREGGVEVRCDTPVDRIGIESASTGERRFWVSTGDDVVRADAVVLANGAGYRCPAPRLVDGLAEGHPRVPMQPALLPLRTPRQDVKGLKGVRVRCAVSLFAREGDTAPVSVERGEVLFRDDGVSGIAVFDLSRYAEPGMFLEIDILPDISQDMVERMIEDLRRAHPDRNGVELLSGMLLKQVALCVMGKAGVTVQERASALDSAALARAVKHYRTKVTGLGDPKLAQVMRGGYATSAFDPATMESRRFAGFFVVGETLDIDGRCGGYNLHWAWTSGFLAGVAAAQ